VWITQYVKLAAQQRFFQPHFVDVKLRSIKQLPAQLARLSLPK